MARRRNAEPPDGGSTRVQEVRGGCGFVKHACGSPDADAIDTDIIATIYPVRLMQVIRS